MEYLINRYLILMCIIVVINIASGFVIFVIIAAKFIEEEDYRKFDQNLVKLAYKIFFATSIINFIMPDKIEIIKIIGELSK